jgi:hypothetical protein
MQKSWFSIIFDLAVLIVLAWVVIHYTHLMASAKEEIEVLRNGFGAVIAMLALMGTCIGQRFEHLLRK